ncbi:MAG: transglutaminase-like domain-containing protein [Pseudomonadota bacterium]
MNAPVLAQLRHCSAFMRTTAAVVVFTFSGLVTAPAAAAIRTAPDTPPGRTISAERQLSNTVRHIKSRLGHLAKKLSEAKPHANDRAELARLHANLEQLARKVRQGFERTGRLIRNKGLPTVIGQRHNEAVAKFEMALTAVQDTLNSIEDIEDEKALLDAVNTLKAQLEGMKLERKHQPFDPEAPLPHHTRQPSEQNKPKTRREQFRDAGLAGNPLPKLAALGDFTFDNLAGASDPAYLGESPEIALTPALRDKAAELNHDPVKIYHWVRNHIEWLPSWGAVQSAEDTLSSAKGNALDIAGLTIALLRASGVPARYVHGTIDVPPDAFRNWAGGFDDLNAAMNYAASGGIPVTALTSGGEISAVRMEHV